MPSLHVEQGHRKWELGMMGCCLWKNVNVGIDLIQCWAHYTWKLLVNETWKKIELLSRTINRKGASMLELEWKYENRLHVSLRIDPDSRASSATALGQVALQIKTLTDLDAEPFPQLVELPTVHLQVALMTAQVQIAGGATPQPHKSPSRCLPAAALKFLWSTWEAQEEKESWFSGKGLPLD